MEDKKDSSKDEQKKIIFEELKKELDPGTIDKIMRSDPSTWTGTCYVGTNCTGGTLGTGGATTISGCVSIGGKSWKGNWPGAGCINT